MKELTIKDKAKRYDEALKKIQKYVKDDYGCTRLRPEDIFPELAESEDEDILKGLISMCQTLGKEEWVAWLEKQGKQDNNEDLDILQRFSFYSYKDEPNILYLSGLYVNKECRNKGIGTKILEVADEVANSLNCHAIRLKTKKGSNAERLYQTHGYNSLASEESDGIWLEKQSGQPADIDNKFIRMRENKPKDIAEFLNRLTTVEQEFLWEHIAKIRELDKEEQKPVKVPKFKAGDFIQFNGIGHTRYTVKEVCGLSHYINTCDKRMDMSYTDANFELVEHSAWSEEDKVMLDEIIDFFENGTVKLQHDLSLYASWLKSLRPQKNNWERVTKEIYFKEPVLIRRKDKSDTWEGYRICNYYTLDLQTDECYIRIKDINNQKQWKPSEEEMKALEFCLEHNIDKDGVFGSKVVKLYDELKKLK